MSREGSAGASDRGGGRRFKSFAEFFRETQKTGDDLEAWVYPSLKFGAVFWISDEITGFGSGGEHPWVIVAPYRRGYPVVVACPRTSQVERNREKGLLLPAGVVSGLDRDGVIVVEVRRNLIAADFRNYRHAGDLPLEWQERLRAELAKRASDVGRQSEEP